MEPIQISHFDSITRSILATALLLVPIFFLPVVGINTAAAKFALLYALLAFATLSYLVARTRDGKFILPSKSFTIAMVLVPAVFTISAIATGRFRDSFGGYGFETTTGLFMLIMSLTALLSSVYINNSNAVKKMVMFSGVSFGIVALYQIIRLIITVSTANANSQVFSLGSFYGTYGNMIGKWNDVAIYSGLVLLATIILARRFSGTYKYIAGTLFVAAGFLAKVVGFSMLWPILAILLAIYIVLDSVNAGKVTIFSKEGMNPYRGIVVGMIVLMSLFYMAISFASRPNSVGQASHPRIHAALNFVPNLFGGIPDEVRPSISSTFGIYKGVLKEHALFGTGPNRFSEGWVKNRPAELNQTAYGDTDFTFGFGYIPTLMTSTGIVGSIALICLFVLAMCQAVYLILRSRDDYDRVLSFGTIYLILMSLLYVPALPLILIMFVGMGAVASRGKNTTITLQNNVFNAVVLKALIALAITLFAIIGTILIKEYRAARYFMQASLAVSQDKNVASAEALLGKTVKLHPTDIYYRGVSELLALKAQVIANQNSKDGKISEEARNVALQTYESSEAAAEKAISLNPTNYSNYLFAGSVFAADPSKLEKAENIYNQALKYSPNNPNVYYGIARIRAQKGDIDGVKYNLQKAIETRPVFTDALIAGAQVKASEKDLRGALDFLAQAYRSNPSRVDLLLIIAQVQYLQLNDINAAIVTLEFAVGNNPNYADGRFGLATLYAKQKNFADAAKLLVGIKTDDEKTKQMLDEYIAKLNAGVDPFVSVTKPKTEATATSTKATSTKTAVKKK